MGNPARYNALSGARKVEVEGPLQKYWVLRRNRQQEIDASIARRADTEFLFDKPYQDNKRIRVSGPFTVESLSPHRVLTPDDPSTPAREDLLNTPDFTHTILGNLKSAGVQNTIKNQRLTFDRIEPFPGLWIQAVGEYAEKDGKPRRAAISIGPEHGTVGPDLIKEAAKEAVKGIPFDLLIVCGFAFDPHVSEEAKRYGDLTVLPTKMNPDLAMGDDLLKKTGAGNLFMVFGEPDLKIDKKDGKLIVHLKGLDVYDPTTGEIRSNSTDDIACWFIDTDYNNESFIVRHAYFTGAGDPYERLKRALKAEVDESAWSALYSTTSYPFDKPSKGKIAVKMINHYGDEVLKVYEV
jgi:adenine-specific DNA-methyltransferase